MARSAYVHIPFCSHKCDFCDFTAFAGLDHLSGEYCRTVCREIKERLAQTSSGSLSTVFYGGGTPGLIPAEELSQIHETLQNYIGIDDKAEITLETTPQAITAAKCQAWQEIGINRLSIGVESFQDRELEAMGRGQNSQDAFKGIEIAKQSGITNLSLDFMYGLPLQTIESWQKTLETALNFKLPHLSAYGLTIATNSPLLSSFPRDSKAYPEEDSFVGMYEALVSIAEAAGLRQYEISNFAIPGFESTHNLSYWNNEEYYAFGVGAHRYVDGVRSSNFRSLNRYLKDWLGSETTEVIDQKKRLQEATFLGLRRRSGINLADFERTYGISLQEQYKFKIEQLVKDGFMSLQNGSLSLTQKGVLVSNLVMSEFM